MRRKSSLALGGVALLLFAAVPAQARLHFSSRERAACRTDAIRYCASTYPNRRRLVNCLQSHRSSLGNRCERALVHGVDERPSLSH